MQIQPEQYADQYAIHRLLGVGGQANVYLASKNGESYAMKVYLPGATKEAAYKIEAEFLGRLKHPHLINMIEHRPQAKFKVNYRPQEKRPVVVLELAEGGELFDYLSKTGKFVPQLARTYAKQLLSAIAYLAEIGITHRDLKPENILFDRNFTLKISDFGLARDAKGELGNNQLTSRVGTQGYKAPEVELGDYEGLKVDIFAIGVILFIMYTGTPPFMSTKSHDRVYRLIRERRYAEFWRLHEKNKASGFYSDSFKRLINSFLSAEPDRRPTFESLEADDWLQGNDISSEELKAQMTDRAIKIGLKTFQKPNLEKMCSKQGYRSDLDLEEESNTKQEIFTYSYFNTHIKTESLPILQSKNATYLDKDANFVIGWINCFLFQQRKDNNTFLDGFVEDIKFVRYSVAQKQGQVKITLDFQINGEDEVQLMLIGSLHKSPKGMIGIDWTKMQGNSFWLSAVKTQIIDSFSSLN